MAKNVKKKILIWSFIAIILIAFAILVFSGKLFNIDGLKRSFSYIGADKNEDGQLTELTFLNQSNNTFADYNGGLAIASATGAEILSIDGKTIVSDTFSMSNPAVITAGERAVFYDIGGTELRVFDEGENTLALTFDYFVTSATLNDSGYLAVVSGESGYKAAVTVYDGNAEQMLTYYVSSGYVLAAEVLPDNSSLIVASVQYENGSFCTKILKLDISSGEETASVYIQDTAVLKFLFLSDDVFAAVSDSAVYFFTSQLEHLGTFDSSGAYLIDAVGGDGFIALLLREQKTGNRARVIALDASGQVQAELELTTEVLDISACGRYVALLYSDKAEIYTYDMELYSSTDATNNARTAIVREDGTLMLVSAASARLFIS